MNNLKNQGVASVKFSMSITLLNLEKLVPFLISIEEIPAELLKTYYVLYLPIRE